MLEIPRVGVSAWAKLLGARGWSLNESKTAASKDLEILWLPDAVSDPGDYQKEAVRVLKRLALEFPRVRCAIEEQVTRLISVLQKNAKIQSP